jgi:hypothetical protein
VHAWQPMHWLKSIAIAYLGMNSLLPNGALKPGAVHDYPARPAGMAPEADNHEKNSGPAVRKT